MAIIVEDGTGVTNANSYVSEAELTTYASARGVSLSGDYTTEQLLLIAMDYIESLRYKGVKVNHTQPLQWPRVDVYIDSYYNDIDNIPKELKNGLMQAALAIDVGNNPQQVVPRKTVMEKVGDLQVQYSNSSSSIAYDPKIMQFLYKLLDAGGSGSINTSGRKG